MSKVLFLDNFDSFSYNLVDEFRRAGAKVEVWRNDAALGRLAERLEHNDLLVLSPGPGRPEDEGVALSLVRRAVGKCPVFGVCMGLQLLATALGGEVSPAPRQVHGKLGLIQHDSGGLFEGLENPFGAGRYHSLRVSEMPGGFHATAWGEESGERVLMAMEDPARRLAGVQFHPESILTRDGGRLIERVLEWAR
ncbi:MAG: aminodeoxychorismate/anthranilate synthase component II [Gammaproteobacteria bacterium]|nr:aminodeoxychorismate/anthranilate synthase component II [Gammaproteobacteria bacterium]